MSEIIIDEDDETNPLVGLVDADGLTGPNLIEIDLSTTAAVGRDGDRIVMERIVDVLQSR